MRIFTDISPLLYMKVTHVGQRGRLEKLIERSVATTFPTHREVTVFPGHHSSMSSKTDSFNKKS